MLDYSVCRHGWLQTTFLPQPSQHCVSGIQACAPIFPPKTISFKSCECRKKEVWREKIITDKTLKRKPSIIFFFCKSGDILVHFWHLLYKDLRDTKNKGIEPPWKLKGTIHSKVIDAFVTTWIKKHNLEVRPSKRDLRETREMERIL